MDSNGALKLFLNAVSKCSHGEKIWLPSVNSSLNNSMLKSAYLAHRLWLSDHRILCRGGAPMPIAVSPALRNPLQIVVYCLRLEGVALCAFASGAVGSRHRLPSCNRRTLLLSDQQRNLVVSLQRSAIGLCLPVQHAFRLRVTQPWPAALSLPKKF